MGLRIVGQPSGHTQENLVKVISGLYEPLKHKASLFLNFPVLSVDILTSRYLASATLLSESEGLLFFHDLLHEPYREEASQLIPHLIGATEARLKSRGELVSLTGSLKIPIWHIFLANLQPLENGNVVVTPELTGVKDFLEKKIRSPLSSDPDRKLLNIALSQLTGFHALRRRIAPPEKKADRPETMGAVIKSLKSIVAIADYNQNIAALEDIEGIQRIRGLAGSGKTAVLAVKAFHLHARNPDWKIGITFYSRSLYQHFKNLIENIASLHTLEPNWDNLRLLHAWGGSEQEGVYSLVSKELGIKPLTYSQAQKALRNSNPRSPSRTTEFDHVIGDLLKQIRLSNNFKPIFDAFLIDEAQDLPESFFELAFYITKDPKRIAYAYDELQSLTDFTLSHPDELFGKDPNGRPNARGLFDQSHDFLLETVYRTNQWILTTGHGLGFGIYRERSQVQAFEQPSLWESFGYEVESGILDFGEEVVLRRKPSAHYTPVEKLFRRADNAVKFKVFNTRENELKWIGSEIQLSLNEGLKHEHIAIVTYDPIKAREYYYQAVQIFNSFENPIALHFVGVSTSPDVVFQEGSIPFMHIFRAKGLEIPLVFVIAVEDGETEGEVSRDLVRRRNFLFTAITRAQGWVRISGVGKKALLVKREFEKLKDKGFKFHFRYPSREDIDRLKTIRADIKKEDAFGVRGQKALEHAMRLLKAGQVEEAMKIVSQFQKEAEELGIFLQAGKRNDNRRG